MCDGRGGLGARPGNAGQIEALLGAVDRDVVGVGGDSANLDVTTFALFDEHRDPWQAIESRAGDDHDIGLVLGGCARRVLRGRRYRSLLRQRRSRESEHAALPGRRNSRRVQARESPSTGQWSNASPRKRAARGAALGPDEACPKSGEVNRAGLRGDPLLARSHDGLITATRH